MTDNSDPFRCTATANTTGDRCRRRAIAGAKYCARHMDRRETDPTENEDDHPQPTTAS